MSAVHQYRICFIFAANAAFSFPTTLIPQTNQTFLCSQRSFPGRITKTPKMYIFPGKLFDIMTHSPRYFCMFPHRPCRLKIGAAHSNKCPRGESEGPNNLGGEANVLQLRCRNRQRPTVAQTVGDRYLLVLHEEGPPPLEQMHLEQLGDQNEDEEVGDYPNAHAASALVE